MKNISLQWEADFIDAADDGSMGYSYGNYTFSAVDTSNNPINSTGIFHTVWKRQSNGTWKFVYD